VVGRADLGDVETENWILPDSADSVVIDADGGAGVGQNMPRNSGRVNPEHTDGFRLALGLSGESCMPRTAWIPSPLAEIPISRLAPALNRIRLAHTIDTAYNLA
jgi:hypothetical protein